VYTNPGGAKDLEGINRVVTGVAPLSARVVVVVMGTVDASPSSVLAAAEVVVLFALAVVVVDEGSVSSAVVVVARVVEVSAGVVESLACAAMRLEERTTKKAVVKSVVFISKDERGIEIQLHGRR